MTTLSSWSHGDYEHVRGTCWRIGDDLVLLFLYMNMQKSQKPSRTPQGQRDQTTTGLHVRAAANQFVLNGNALKRRREPERGALR